MILDAFEGGKSTKLPAPYAWVLESAAGDDLSGDFMAPLFRGALTPTLSRGRALRTFWREQFRWGASDDRQGYEVREESATHRVSFDDDSRPL